MCGIAGLWAPGIDPGERRALVDAMLQRVASRGPDGRAVWGDDQVVLGITRLAIVAPLEPAQVLANETSTLHAVVNGEIYNHVALRRGLLERGHVMSSRIDTGVMIHLYEELELEFPGRLDGMFAAAVWDPARRRLVLARDRAGEKPMFYSVAPGRIAFASTPAAFFALPWVARDPSAEAMARYLVHGYFAGEDCAFAAIRQLPPAHVIELGEGVARATRYWRPWDVVARGTHPGPTTTAMVRETRELLEEVVASRAPDDVPFGVFLSGGLDSGVIAALLARRHPGLATFHLRLPERGYDESYYAAETAKRLGTTHHEFRMEVDGIEEALEQCLAGMEQPLGDPSVLPTWALARHTSGHVPVVLTGEGGDELFAGYPTYLGHRYSALVDRMPTSVIRGLSAVLRGMGPGTSHVSLPNLARRFLDATHMDPLERHMAWFGNVATREASALLAPALRERVAEESYAQHTRAFSAALRAEREGRWLAAGDLRLYQLFDYEYYLGSGLLTKVDRCAMAHGLESRAPFLAQRFTEHALTLPESARVRGARGKWILKEIARDLLPDSVIFRRKQGFSPPFSSWARGPLRGWLTARLSEERVARAGVMDPAAVGEVLRQHLEGRAERGRTLWALLSLQSWAEHWVIGHAGSAAPNAQRSEPARDRAGVG